MHGTLPYIKHFSTDLHIFQEGSELNRGSGPTHSLWRLIICSVCNIVICLMYRELGEDMTDDELRAMITEFDKDGDGESK